MALLLCLPPQNGGAQATGDTTLVGLWAAHKSFRPELRGRLVVERSGGIWRAELGGRSAVADAKGDSLSLALPGGSFSGRFNRRRDARGRATLTGHWIQSPTVTSGYRFATPVILTSCGPDCFSGDVVPVDDQFTFFLRVTRRPDGTLAAFLRNPDRNLGRFIRADRIERDSGGTVRILGADGKPVITGVMRGEVMTLFLDDRGGSYDFTRVPADAWSDFYPRGRPAVTYAYEPPRRIDDGWSVGTVEQVGISGGKITELMQQLVNASSDSMNAPRLHAIAIARHGKLVVEEYFFGEHADKPHDTRSGSKTVLNVVIGVAMQVGLPVSPDLPVYATMGDTTADPRKRALKLEHLINMASGLDCDDNAPEPQPPGSEDVLTQQDTNPDWYRMILGLKMVRDPGAQAVYCSINPHLAGGVVARATHRPLLDLIWTLVGQPLQMRHYYVPLAPLGEPYMGGGMRLCLRDYMKLAQLFLNGGTWNGRRVVSAEWVRRSTEPRYPMGPTTHYGHLWWMGEYQYGGRSLRYYFAAGNGGQISLAIPDLDLVVAAFGGNYADRAARTTTDVLIPRYVLPAIEP